jgi:hypothetical protein
MGKKLRSILIGGLKMWKSLMLILSVCFFISARTLTEQKLLIDSLRVEIQGNTIRLAYEQGSHEGLLLKIEVDKLRLELACQQLIDIEQEDSRILAVIDGQNYARKGPVITLFCWIAVMTVALISITQE